MSGKKLRGGRLGRHKLLIYKQRIVYFSCIYSEPINSTIKSYFGVRQQYPAVLVACQVLGLDKLDLEVFEIGVVQLKPALQGAIRNPPLALEKGNGLLQDVLELHPRSSVCC